MPFTNLRFQPSSTSNNQCLEKPDRAASAGRKDLQKRLRSQWLFAPKMLLGSSIREFDRIGLIACSRVQAIASAGISAGVATASELLEYLPVLIESNGNYINDIHNNILYGARIRHNGNCLLFSPILGKLTSPPCRARSLSGRAGDERSRPVRTRLPRRI